MSSLFYSFLFSILFSSTASRLKSTPLPINSVPSQIMNHSALCRFSSFLLCAVASQLDSNACPCISSLRLRSTHHISSLSSRSDATLCLRGSELIISFQHDSFSGRLHSVPWLIISVLCRFFSLLIHAMPFQSISVLCHNFSGRCCSNLILSTLSLSYSVHGLFFCNATLFLRLSWLFFTHPPLYCSSLHYSLPSLAISLLRLFHA